MTDAICYLSFLRSPPAPPDKDQQCQKDDWNNYKKAYGEGPVLRCHWDICALAFEADLARTLLIGCARKILTFLKFCACLGVAVVIIGAEPSHTVFTITFLMCGTAHSEALLGVSLDLERALGLVCACLPQTYVGHAILVQFALEAIASVGVGYKSRALITTGAVPCIALAREALSIACARDPVTRFLQLMIDQRALSLFLAQPLAAV